MDIFKKQDIFVEQMLNDYKNGMCDEPILVPYFNWKSGNGVLPTLKQSRLICAKIELILGALYKRYPKAYELRGSDPDDPWCDYVGYGEHKYLVSYLEYIDDEVIGWIYRGLVC